MNKKQYNNVIEYTLNHSEANDSLSTARAIFTNMGVALPQGDMKTVYETISTNDYMGWRECTAQQAQAAADNGVAAIGISEDKIVVISAYDEEDPATQTDSVMTLTKNALAVNAARFSYYEYNSMTTILENYLLWVCPQTENDCYKSGTSIGTVKGIVVHSTGANNPDLKRYVDAPELVGTNAYGNHWNQSGIPTMVHAFIGLDKNGKTAIVNTLPYNYACWGVGNGSNGSYNYSPNGHIQFEICEDGLTNGTYFNDAVFGAAVEYCAYLCKKFNLSVDSIVSHKEAHLAGYGSNHGDPDHWLSRFGKTMNDFRNAVRRKING